MLSKSITNNKFYWHDEEITEAEYNNILEIIKDKPVAPDGYDYRLTTDLQWELYELPTVEEETDDIATVEDYQNALTELGVDFNA